jgi:CDP-6-deoxy-D-xylo-4-hexulose-3-dehydrase
MQGRNYRVSGELTQSDVVMNRTFWIGVQPALGLQQMDWAATCIERYLGIDF